jgi:hypothetical protein
MAGTGISPWKAAIFPNFGSLADSPREGSPEPRHGAMQTSREPL